MHTTIPTIDDMGSEMRELNRYLFQNRSIIVDSHAFGSFRKDLIHNIGLERTKGFLFRYGWNMGVQDARECKKKKYNTIDELIEYGPMMHSMKGYVESKTLKLEYKQVNDGISLQMESTWKHSFEADEHLEQIGTSSSPICYTLSGYASGFVTEVCGQKVIFKEMCCRGTGSKECRAIGKTQDLWGNEIKDELYYLEETPIFDELELTYEKLLEERDQLTKANDIQKRLTEEVVKGSSLDSIIQELYKLCGFPVVIHNVHGHPLTAAGVTALSRTLTPNGLFQYINKSMTKNTISQTFQTINGHHESYFLMTHPIYIQEKRMGYCSFIFKNHEVHNQELLHMIIETVASVCSLCFLYEKTKLDSFEQMKSFFLEEMISGHFSSEDEMIAKAGLFQFDLTKPYYLSIIGYSFNSNDFRSELVFCREVMATISYFFTKQNQHTLINQNDHHIHLLVTDHFSNNENRDFFFEELIKFLYSRFPGSHFYMGISKKTNSILDVPNAYKEALGAKRMVSQNKQMIFFDTLGMVGSLINDRNENDVRKMAKLLLGNLEMSCQKDIDLIRTLYSFLLNGGNLEKTADELSLSISGLRYRVNKIEELLQKDIRSPIMSCQLLMAIQALIILGELNIKDPVM
ncbi:XylR N-terminal domain-containing protein [Bacillus sp. V3B]|uniref:XylR N-terminal domain-containing protein n=1 Tax=Bacillus sp. V3B TaxID=2804915 RepID=UPI00210C23AA|nr:XylR N-terminal domain-containing protein [Bacillus sp. V3B]MCQ6276141.1 XylR N-terminal domain-containing protein [Bacillus sp. V3B]